MALSIKEQIGAKSIPLNSKSGLPAYYMAAFPEPLQVWAKSIQGAYNIEASYTLTSALSVFGALLGNKVKGRIKDKHMVTPNLFVMLVGRSGAAKSPAIKLAVGYVLQRDLENNKRYRKELQEWAERETAAKTAKQDFNELRPAFVNRHTIKSATLEAIYKHYQYSNTGTIIVGDEFASIYGNLINNRYGGGDNRGAVLGFLDCEITSTDTVKDGSLFMDNHCISMLAGTQPDRLKDYISKTSDGLMERFLYAINTLPYRAYSFESIDESITHAYENTLQKLMDIDVRIDNQHGNIEPEIIPFSPEALRVYIDWDKENEDIINSGSSEAVRTIYTKMTGYAPRLALILQMLYYVCNEESKNQIGVRAITSAIELMKYYLQTSIVVNCEYGDTDPANKLSVTDSKFYNAVPDDDEVKTSDLYTIGARIGVSKDKVKRLLRNKDLFKCIKHGIYAKV